MTLIYYIELINVLYIYFHLIYAFFLFYYYFKSLFWNRLEKY